MSVNTIRRPVAKFAVDGLKAKRAAILFDQKEAYSTGLRDNFRQAFVKMGGTITTEQAYTGGNPDFSAQLATIRDSKPDVVFIPGYYTDVGNIARQARERAGLKVPLLGESTTGVPNVLEGFPGFSYVAVVEAAMGGATGRPMFIGRLDTSVDDRWHPSPMLIGGAPEAPAGSLLFAIDGRLIGMVLPQFGSLAVVPPAALNSVVTELGGGAGNGGGQK